MIRIYLIFVTRKRRHEAVLLLGRNLGESIVIGDNIYITFVESDKNGHKFRLAIDAPKDVKIVRGELYPAETVQHEKLSKVTISKKAAQKPDDSAERPA